MTPHSRNAHDLWTGLVACESNNDTTAETIWTTVNLKNNKEVKAEMRIEEQVQSFVKVGEKTVKKPLDELFQNILTFLKTGRVQLYKKGASVSTWFN